jgi:predicted RNA-binding protein YlxR (DUF448 family)
VRRTNIYEAHTTKDVRCVQKNVLIRLVRDNKTGEIKFDCDKKLFGRGAYICKNIDCIRNAEKKRGIERHFKCAVPKELYKAAEELI